VFGAQGGQDPDHHHVRVDRPGLLLGRVQAGPDVLLELRGAGADQPARGHVDLDVELAQLGLEARVGDGGQHVGVAHGRLRVLVDQVQLDLQAGHRPLHVEPRLAQHLGEDVEAAAYLLPVAGPVLTAEGPRTDVLAHGHHLVTAGSPNLARRGGAGKTRRSSTYPATALVIPVASGVRAPGPAPRAG
jgi:hypothetical protein